MSLRVASNWFFQKRHPIDAGLYAKVLESAVIPLDFDGGREPVVHSQIRATDRCRHMATSSKYLNELAERWRYFI